MMDFKFETPGGKEVSVIYGTVDKRLKYGFIHL